MAAERAGTDRLDPQELALYLRFNELRAERVELLVAQAAPSLPQSLVHSRQSSVTTTLEARWLRGQLLRRRVEGLAVRDAEHRLALAAHTPSLPCSEPPQRFLPVRFVVFTSPFQEPLVPGTGADGTTR